MAISLPPIARQRAKRKEYHGNLVHGRRKRAQAANPVQGTYANIGTMTFGTFGQVLAHVRDAEIEIIEGDGPSR
jgi:hypothetical protein